MAQDHGLCKKKKSKMDPAHGPPLQARVAAANGTVLAACKLLALTRRSWRTWNEQGQTKQSKMNWGKQTERGQELMRAVGMAGKGVTAGTQPADQAMQANTASGFSVRLRPRRNKRPTVGRPCSKQQQPQSCPASCRAGRWGGVQCVGTQEGGCRPT